MESQSLNDPYEAGKRSRLRRKRCVILGVACALLLLVVVVTLAVVLGRRKHSDPLQETFLSRCKGFPGYDCQNLWTLFQRAYVGKESCNITWDSYDPLIAAAPFQSACNKMMFWSKTNDVVHDFTEKKDCFITLEDTVLGSTLDGLTWCGKEGSTETFTSDCPGWTECVNNPVRSFWRRMSASFADAACGNVTAMLNGSLAMPFSTESFFAIEVGVFNPTRVNGLSIVLVTPETPVSNCTNASLRNLLNRLDKDIQYTCTEVSESELKQCSSGTEKPCGPCW